MRSCSVGEKLNKDVRVMGDDKKRTKVGRGEAESVCLFDKDTTFEHWGYQRAPQLTGDMACAAVNLNRVLIDLPFLSAESGVNVGRAEEGIAVSSMDEEGRGLEPSAGDPAIEEEGDQSEGVA